VSGQHIGVQIDEAQLASRAGTDVAMVRRLRHLGIVPADAGFDDNLVPRVRLAVQLERSGVSLEALAQSIADGDLSIEFFDRTFLRPVGMLDTTYRDLAAELGTSEAFGEAVQLALGVPALAGPSWVREDDAKTMKALAQLVELGIDEAVMISLFQIMADNLRKMARAASEMWGAGVKQPLLEEGKSHRELLGARSVNSAEFQELGEQITLHLWSRFLEEEIFRGTIETLEMALEETGAVGTRDDQPPAIVFLDLTAFTHLTDSEGDEVAADGARHLVDVVRRTTVRWGGTLVKMLGDGAMLHFRDPTAAVRCSLALADDIADAGLPPSRFGVNAGPLIVRDVDFFGQTVNVAARLVDYARPGEVLITAEVVAAAHADDLRFTEIGPVSLKGLASPVTVFSAESSAPSD
jgi:adenylate cyclase